MIRDKLDSLKLISAYKVFWNTTNVSRDREGI